MKLVAFTVFLCFSFINGDEVVTGKNLWDQIIKMEQIVVSVEYNGRRLNVWREDAHGYSRFYVTPLCVLDTSSIKCDVDDYGDGNHHAFTFSLLLWDSLAAETVQLALRQKGIEARASDIIPMPMQMARLSINREVTSKLEIDTRWRSYQNQPNAILFDLIVKDEKFCHKMVSDAKTNPETFLARTKLFFEFTMFVGQQASRVVNITGKTIAKSDFFSKLVNDYSDKTGMVYLQSDDFNKLARDIYRTVATSDEVSADYIPSHEENQIISELLNVIKDQQVHSSELNSAAWDSVFWNDIFSRPDIQTSYFNETLSYDSKNTHFKYDKANDKQFREKIEKRYEEQQTNSKGGGGGFSVFGLFGAKASGSKTTGNNKADENINEKETKDSSSISKDEFEKAINSNGVNVQWTGEKFEPKNLMLNRVNTKNLQSSGEILYKRVVTTKLATTQEIQIQAEPYYTTDYNNTISPVYYEALDNTITNLTATLKTNIARIETQINNAFALINNANSLITQNTDGRTELRTLLNQANEKISGIEADHGNTKSRLTTLIECSHVVGACHHLPLA